MDRTPFERALRKVPAIGAATLCDGTTDVAGFGSVADHPEPGSLTWEIGSITKVFTGILLADMAIRGEVALDDPIGRHTPPEVGARLPSEEDQPTLLDLATHTSGLPRLPYAWLRRIRKDPDPYSTLTQEDVWNVLGPSTRRPRRRRPKYSNFGMGLLGHLLARAAGAPYTDLVRQRILDPLGMAATGVGIGEPVPGFRKSEPTPPWTFGALEGAGALRSTLGDMLGFAATVIEPPTHDWDRRLSLARSVHHRGRLSAMGLGWQIRRIPGRESETIWHNGGTYGAASFLAVDIDARNATVVFGNTGPRLTSPLDRVGWRVLDSL